MKVRPTSIAGLLLFELKILPDERGSFCEAMNLKEMYKLGLPESFKPNSQWNISKSKYGVIRGIHAEPWNKLIAIPIGSVYSAIVDLRPASASYRQVEIIPEFDENFALFVPKGCGNSYAATSFKDIGDPKILNTYTYLVDDYWYQDETYPMVAFDDPTFNIPWPILEADRIVSAKDRQHPRFVPR